jgi:gliding motility-associated-like protein
MMQVKSTYLFLLVVLSFSLSPIRAQVLLAFQGGEPGNTWNYISSGADATAQAQTLLLNNIVSGTQSIVVGGNTGGGSCIDGGSGNGPAVARFFTFDPVDISSSSDFFRTLTFNWGSRQPICVGTGWDSGENLVFTAYHDGVAQPSETLAVGNNNANFSLQNHNHTHNIPPCVNSFYFHITITTNRRDELLFLDDVTLFAPQLNAGGSGGTNVNLAICQSELPYNWNGLIFNQAGTQTVTLTSSYGCDSLVNYILNVNNPILPTFNVPTTYCSGANIPALPTTSSNGINGVWSPAINSASTTTYTFTPTSGQCANTTTLTINISPNLTPSFAPVNAICSGASIAALPTNSLNGISGTWSPAVNNQQTTTYTFTPTVGQCATQTTLSIEVLPNVLPTFNPLTSYCAGAVIPALPTNALNNISGSWSPAINNQQTTTYTFTPNAGQCATTATVTIDIQSNITPTFNPPGTYCIGANIPDLPQTSTNAITGTWSPAINNTQTTSYTFTPNAGFCATSTSLTIPVAAAFIPEFNDFGPYCEGAVIQSIPTTSINGINGSWSPAINNTATTTYTFTPLPDQCAAPTTKTLIINPNETPNFTNYPSFCAGVNIPSLPTTSTNGIDGTWSPNLNNQQTTTYTFTPNANECAIPTNMTVVVNPIVLPQFEPNTSYCYGASIPAFPETSTNNITGSWSPQINNNITTTYTFTPNPQYCSQPVTSTITIFPADTTSFLITVCQNQLPYLWQGMSLNDVGTYHQSLTSSQGCDSVLLLNLTIVSNIIQNQNLTICAGDFPFVFYDQNIEAPGIYEHTTNNLSGCDTTYILHLNMHQPLQITLDQSPIISCNESLNLSYSISSTHQITQCNWSMNDQTGNNCDGFNVSLSDFGCYDLILEAVDIYGCSNTLQQWDIACIYPNPNASFSLQNTLLETGQYVQPINQSEGANSFIWDFGDDSFPNTEVYPQHIYNESGDFEISLTATNEYGCTDTYTQLVSVGDPLLFFVPNAFTPGGFDLNEEFLPVLTSGINKQQYRLLIFNRWGEVLFESLNSDKGWDGTYGNELCPSGVYVWQIEFENSRGTKERHQGHVSLLR